MKPSARTKRLQVVVHGARGLKPRTLVAVGKLMNAVHAHYSKKCVDRGTHIACRKGL